MKKIYGILMLAMLAMCSVVLVSCGGDDDDNNNNPLIGTWVWEDRDSYGYYYQEYIFKSDYTLVWRELEDRNRWDTGYGTYSVAGNKLTTIIEAGDETEVDEFTFTISGNKLILQTPTKTKIYTKK